MISEQQISDPMIVYYDGVCGICNHTVNWILKRDRTGGILFAQLQGETARRKLSQTDAEDLNSIVVTLGSKKYRKSAAVVRILWKMGGLNAVLGTLLWLIPFPIRDLGYKLVARVRYRLFGKLETCRILRPEEQSRFLD
jgi:predicted DCC family thiol-disulfide oxidoreductase YuxK